MTANWLMDLEAVGILFAPHSFAVADSSELSEVCNGAGTDGLDVPDSFFGLKITDAADIHDWMYHNASTAEDKWIADFVFLINMLVLIVWSDRNADNKYKGLLYFLERRKFWLRLKLACVYYVAVNRWGICENIKAKKPLWARFVDWLRRIV